MGFNSGFKGLNTSVWVYKLEGKDREK